MKTYPVVDLQGDARINRPFNNSNARANIRNIIVHHDAMDSRQPFSTVDRLRVFADGHTAKLQPGLSYHIVIDDEGTIFYCRPWELRTYHCGNYEVNMASIAVMVMGDFTKHGPSQEQYEALRQVLTELSYNHPEFPASYPHVYGHREVAKAGFGTACPGGLLGFVQQYRSTGWHTAIPQVGYRRPDLQPATPAPAPPAPAPTPAPPAPTEPDYKLNVKELAEDVFVATAEVPLVNLETGAVEKKMAAGTPFTITRGTTKGTTPYLITKYSAGKNIWKGMPADLLVPKSSVPIPEPPAPTKPPAGTPPAQQPTDADHQKVVDELKKHNDFLLKQNKTLIDFIKELFAKIGEFLSKLTP